MVHLGTPGAEVSGAVLVCLAVIYVQKNGEKNLQPMGKSIVTTAIRGLPFSRSCTTSLTGLPILGGSSPPGGGWEIAEKSRKIENFGNLQKCLELIVKCLKGLYKCL